MSKVAVIAIFPYTAKIWSGKQYGSLVSEVVDQECQFRLHILRHFYRTLECGLLDDNIVDHD